MDTMKSPRFILAWMLTLSAIGVAAGESRRAGPPAGRPNVLLLILDDLRPELGCYDIPGMHTPALDRIASGGVLFDRAYTPQAVCLPARISLMTGMHPDRTGVHDLQTNFRRTIPEATTLVAAFRGAGYRTIGMGKVFHDEQPLEWDDWTPLHHIPEYARPETLERLAAARAAADAAGLKGAARRQAMKGPAWESADVPDTTYHDGAMTEVAIAKLKENRGNPFLMVVGYKRPHLPFNAPSRYWALHQEADVKLPSNYRTGTPTAPDLAITDWGELRAYSDIPDIGQVSDEQALTLIRGYRATVSYVDAQISRLMEALRENGLEENTVVVVCGVHGFKLGDHGLWSKHTNFEVDTRVPLIVRAPGRMPASVRTDALVELTDLYPTLCSLASIPVPSQCEGSDLAELFRKDASVPWRSVARSQFKRDRKTGGDIVGYSIRTNTHRYNEWRNIETGRVVASELYDHRADPDENVNLASDQQTAALRAELSRSLVAAMSRTPP
jgi:iduronate 2-sulfatase